MTPKQRLILDTLDGKGRPIPSKWIAQLNKKPNGWCGQALSKLVQDGLVSRSYPDFKYALTEAGQATIAEHVNQEEDSIDLNW